MVGHRDRPDDPGRSDQPRPYSAADLRSRVDQLPEAHPSSPKYRGGRDNGPVNLRKLELGSDDVRSADAARKGSDVADQPDREAHRSGWDSPGVSDHSDKPSPDTIGLSDDRKQHILDGDQWGGGHRHGRGRGGKTEFPPDWDDDQISGTILDVARQPEQPPVYQGWNGRWLVVGTRNNVEVSVVVQSDGRIWTAWPEEGSPGVGRNPKKGTP